MLVLNDDTLCCQECWEDAMDEATVDRPELLRMGEAPGECAHCGKNDRIFALYFTRAELAHRCREEGVDIRSVVHVQRIDQIVSYRGGRAWIGYTGQFDPDVMQEARRRGILR